MPMLPLLLAVIAVLGAGYLLYGRWIARQYRLDPEAVTPAVARNDGVDFVPTRPFYLMAQHFSAIAAAGPIVGPIAACQAFGWLPCVLWILLGVIFIGAVHDFSALVASVRHGAHSIAEIARVHLGRRAWLSLVAFIWLALVYVIVAFTDVTAQSFQGRAEELELLSGRVTFNLGGAVAASSVLYLALALVMGLVQRFLRPPMWLLTAVFVPGTLGVIWLGTRLDSVFVLGVRDWHVLILAYCFVASMLPMWLLQQPRGFLGGFVLYLAIAIGIAGLAVGGFSVQAPAVRPPASLGAWAAGGEGAPRADMLLLPFVFVTIACGACSGFHGLVCGGTTSKQIARETHCMPIGFGAMLLEGLVAVLALATIMIVPAGSGPARPPAVTFGEGMASFIVAIFGEESRVFARTFGTMAVATFIFDTLDVATRLGRYLLLEVLVPRGAAPPARARVLLVGGLASLATVGAPLLVLSSGTDGSWRSFWTLFGTANQLLAGLTLLGITVWLRRTGRRSWIVGVPMVFVMSVTVVALAMQIVDGARVLRARGAVFDTAVINAGVACALLVLAGVFASSRPAPGADAPARRAS